jgi:hypothetical protein
MAMSLYAYVSQTGASVHINDSNVAFTGSYSPSTTYAAFDAVVYGNHLFIAVASGSNVPPPNFSGVAPLRIWSPLVGLDNPATISPMTEAQAAFSLALTAVQTAWTGTSAGSAALAQLSTASAGTTTAWAATTENGALLNRQMTFVNGLLTHQSVDSVIPTSTDEIYSFVKFFDFICTNADANACIGTFAVNLLDPNFSWTNSDSRLYNRIGTQDITGMNRVMVLDGAFDSAGTVMTFLVGGGNGLGKFASTSNAQSITKLLDQGTYYLWNKDGAPPGTVAVSLRLDGLVFIGG